MKVTRDEANLTSSHTKNFAHTAAALCTNQHATHGEIRSHRNLSLARSSILEFDWTSLRIYNTKTHIVSCACVVILQRGYISPWLECGAYRVVRKASDRPCSFFGSFFDVYDDGHSRNWGKRDCRASQSWLASTKTFRVNVMCFMICRLKRN